MKVTGILTAAVVAAAVSVFVVPLAWADWAFNVKVYQLYADPQDNYEVVLQGDWTDYTDYYSGRYFPPGWTMDEPTYEAGKTTYKFHSIGSGGELPYDEDTYYYFGVEAPGEGYILEQYWTPGAHMMPTSTPSFHHNPATNEMILSIINSGAHTIDLSKAYYRVFPYYEIPLDELDDYNWPLEEFTDSGIPFITLEPGALTNYTVGGVFESSFFVTAHIINYSDDRFPDLYPGEVTMYARIRVADLAPVEPESLGRIKAQFR